MLHFVERALHISEHTNTGITVSQHYVLTPETRLFYFSFNTILGHLDLLTFADPVMDITLALGPTVFTVWAPVWGPQTCTMAPDTMVGATVWGPLTTLGSKL